MNPYAFFIVGLVVGLAFGFAVRRRKTEVTHLHQDANIDMLDRVLHLDRALYDDENNRIGAKNAPHIGIWIYVDSDGFIRADNRYTGGSGDVNRSRGVTAGHALFYLLKRLQDRVAERREAFDAAEKKS